MMTTRRDWQAWAVLALFLVGLTGPISTAALAQRKEVPPSRAAAQYSFAPIVKQAAPAVVNVYVRSKVKVARSPFANDPFFRRFFGDSLGGTEERMQSSLGSGVIVSPDGIVVTNTHVVKARGETEIRIALADKRELDAKVIAQDERTDIAVLRIEGGEGPFPFLAFEDSDSIEVGDLVLAIGNPFSVGQTVTSGIVSALARTEIGRSDAQIFIQTDAAINPGNSGGALVDMAGKLVGINTAIYSSSGGSHGIGFAIPSNLVRLSVESAIAGRKLERPWLGAKIETITRDIADGMGLDRVAGAMVMRVAPKSPAAEAGLLAGDVIVGVGEHEVADARALNYRLTTLGIGQRARLAVLRKGRPTAVDVALKPPPQPGRDDARDLSGDHPLSGARVANLLASIADEIGIEETEGVVVLSVSPGGTAGALGFQTGDVVVQVGKDKISSLKDLEAALARPQRVWRLDVKRGGRLLRLQLPG